MESGEHMSSTTDRSWRPDPATVRQSIIEAGIELLAEEGVALAADRMSIERAAARAKVSRAAAYKLWTGLDERPQDAFRNDVLLHAAEQVLTGTEDELNGTMGVIMATLQRYGPIPELDPEERHAVLREVVRVGALSNLQQLVNSSNWHVYLSVLANVCSRGGADEPAPLGLVGAIRTGSDRAAALYGPMYLALGQIFGMRIRPGYRIEQFTVAAASLVDGVALRADLSEHVDGITGPYPSEGPWHLFAVSFLALVREFFEADPDVPWGTAP